MALQLLHHVSQRHKGGERWLTSVHRCSFGGPSCCPVHLFPGTVPNVWQKNVSSLHVVDKQNRVNSTLINCSVGRQTKWWTDKRNCWSWTHNPGPRPLVLFMAVVVICYQLKGITAEKPFENDVLVCFFCGGNLKQISWNDPDTEIKCWLSSARRWIKHFIIYHRLLHPVKGHGGALQSVLHDIRLKVWYVLDGPPNRHWAT